MKTMKHLGLVRIGMAVPALKLANTEANSREIIRLIQEAEEKNTGFLLFPELAITGSSCGDLFYQGQLYQKQLAGLAEICEATKGKTVCVILGFYLREAGQLYNCTALIQNGAVQGVVPKRKGRWFASEIDANRETVRLLSREVPFGRLIFEDQGKEMTVGIGESEESSFGTCPAQIVFHPSADSEEAGKAAFRKNLITVESAKHNCAYVYVSAGIGESTSDLVFGGHGLMAENGEILAENERFRRRSTVTYSEVDFARIQFAKIQAANGQRDQKPCRRVALLPVQLVREKDKLYRKYSKTPFLADNAQLRDAQCEDIFHIQAVGLAERLKRARAKKSVIGVSGGLDSTLALLVCAYAHRLAGLSAEQIVAVTMPGFGTTDKTYRNAVALMRLLGAEVREISIEASVLQHFEDIGQNPNQHDVTFENAQARERTQILMDIANKENGMVIGTGDLSEMALGWCTYNGDHMSMYGVNAGVPKTVLRHVVRWVMEHKLSGRTEDRRFSMDNLRLIKVLQDILDTPISPELLPPDPSGDIAQKTEESVGPYVLHDFFLYHTMRCGMSPARLLFAATRAFEGEYDAAFIQKWLSVFYKRFFSQQFKRNCVPDGPKTGPFSLSPRDGWRMPSDADAAVWLKE